MTIPTIDLPEDISAVPLTSIRSWISTLIERDNYVLENGTAATEKYHHWRVKFEEGTGETIPVVEFVGLNGELEGDRVGGFSDRSVYPRWIGIALSNPVESVTVNVTPSFSHTLQSSKDGEVWF